MASIPGVRFDITGASGTQNLLSPKESWRAYILPRGGHASQDSTGTLITFDDATVASRFAANDWLQAGLSPDNIRQVSAVGGNSISVSGANLTVSENDRIYLIGATQPTVTGGSATYLVPATIVRQRDDDGSSIFTNSQITSNADGLIQGFAETNFYDAIIQDGNQANQGSIVDLSVGVVEGVSVSTDALFGASLTVNGAFGVTGWATFGSTVTMDAALGVTGTLVVGATATFNAALGVTGTAIIGATLTANAAFGVTGTVVIGATLTASAALTVGDTLSVTGLIVGSSDVGGRRFNASEASVIVGGDFTLNGWGSTATLVVGQSSFDQAGRVSIITGGATFGANPTVALTFTDGTWARGVMGVVTCMRTDPANQVIGAFLSGEGVGARTWTCGVTATHGEIYQCEWTFFGKP